MNKEKLKRELKVEILDSIMSNDLIDKIADKVSEKVIAILPESVKSEITLQKYSELYGKRNPLPDFNLSTIEQKAKQIQDYNKRHSALTPPKPRDFEEELEGRRKAIESIQEEHSDY